MCATEGTRILIFPRKTSEHIAIGANLVLSTSAGIATEWSFRMKIFWATILRTASASAGVRILIRRLRSL
jgi:hypothetical protein